MIYRVFALVDGELNGVIVGFAKCGDAGMKESGEGFLAGGRKVDGLLLRTYFKLLLAYPMVKVVALLCLVRIVVLEQIPA